MSDLIPDTPRVQPEAPKHHASPLPWVIVSIVLFLIITAGAIAGYFFWPEACVEEQCKEVAQEIHEVIVTEGVSDVPIAYDTEGSVTDFSDLSYIYSVMGSGDLGIDSCQRVADMANLSTSGVDMPSLNQFQDSIVFLDSFHGLIYDHIDSPEQSDDLIGDLDNFISSDDIDNYHQLCLDEGVAYLTGASSHHEIYVLSLDLNEEMPHWQIHQPIIDVIDYSYNLIDLPELGVVIVEGYGDMGYLGWRAYYLDIESGATDLIEQCSGYSEYDADEFLYGCHREYVPLD